MDTLYETHEKLAKNGNLSKSLQDVQKTLDMLVKARSSIAASKYGACLFTHQYLPTIDIGADHSSASVVLAKLQNPVKQSLENVNSGLRNVYKGLGAYSKVLDKVG